MAAMAKFWKFISPERTFFLTKTWGIIRELLLYPNHIFTDFWNNGTWKKQNVAQINFQSPAALVTRYTSTLNATGRPSRSPSSNEKSPARNRLNQRLQVGSEGVFGPKTTLRLRKASPHVWPSWNSYNKQWRTWVRSEIMLKHSEHRILYNFKLCWSRPRKAKSNPPIDITRWFQSGSFVPFLFAHFPLL